MKDSSIMQSGKRSALNLCLFPPFFSSHVAEQVSLFISGGNLNINCLVIS